MIPYGDIGEPPPLKCRCGSGLDCDAEYDGYGIFLFVACDKCRDEKLSRYRPDIMTQYETDEPIEPED